MSDQPAPQGVTQEQFDAWLADAASRMEIMHQKVKERDVLIRALVLSCGGKIQVHRSEQIEATNATLTVAIDPENDSRIFSVHSKEAK